MSLSVHAITQPLTKALLSGTAPTSITWQGSFCSIFPTLTTILLPLVFIRWSSSVLKWHQECTTACFYFYLKLLGWKQCRCKQHIKQARLACYFCCQQKISCHPVCDDGEDKMCKWVLSIVFWTSWCGIQVVHCWWCCAYFFMECAKQTRQCEYPEMSFCSLGKKQPHSDNVKEIDKEDPPPLPMTRRQA